MPGVWNLDNLNRTAAQAPDVSPFASLHLTCHREVLGGRLAPSRGVYLSPFGPIECATRDMTIKPSSKQASVWLPPSVCQLVTETLDVVSLEPIEADDELRAILLRAWLAAVKRLPMPSRVAIKSLDTSYWLLRAAFEQGRNYGIEFNIAIQHVRHGHYSPDELASIARVVYTRGYSPPIAARALETLHLQKKAARLAEVAARELARQHGEEVVTRSAFIIDLGASTSPDSLPPALLAVVDAVGTAKRFVVDLKGFPAPLSPISFAPGVRGEFQTLALPRKEWAAMPVVPIQPFLADSILASRSEHLDRSDLTAMAASFPDLSTVEGRWRASLAREAISELRNIGYRRIEIMSDLSVALELSPAVVIDLLIEASSQRWLGIDDNALAAGVLGALKGGAARYWRQGELARPMPEDFEGGIEKAASIESVIASLAKTDLDLGNDDILAALQSAGVVSGSGLNADQQATVTACLTTEGFIQVRRASGGVRRRLWTREGA